MQIQKVGFKEAVNVLQAFHGTAGSPSALPAHQSQTEAVPSENPPFGGIIRPLERPKRLSHSSCGTPLGHCRTDEGWKARKSLVQRSGRLHQARPRRGALNAGLLTVWLLTDHAIRRRVWIVFIRST
jgi:hypothetical protein